MNTRQILSRGLIALFSLALLAGAAQAEDWSKLGAKKQTKLGLYMTSQQAYDHVMANMGKTLFVDLRTPGELDFLGVTTVMDAHVPYKFMDSATWDDKKHAYKEYKNKDFVADMAAVMAKKGLGKDDIVILICRSGNRSAAAANDLADAGYTKVYTVVDGYEGDKAKSGPDKGRRTVNGWKNAGLPWTYHLNKDIMYFTK